MTVNLTCSDPLHASRSAQAGWAAVLGTGNQTIAGLLCQACANDPGGTYRTAKAASDTASDNRATIEQGTDACMAVLAKIGAGTVPGTTGMPAQLATLLSFLPATDTAATTAAHGLLMIRAEAKLTRLLVRLVRGDFSGTS